MSGWLCEAYYVRLVRQDYYVRIVMTGLLCQDCYVRIIMS